MNSEQLDDIEAKARAALAKTRGQWWVEFYNGKAYLKDQMGQLAGFTIMSQDAAHLAAACYPAAVLDLVAEARRAQKLEAEMHELTPLDQARDALVKGAAAVLTGDTITSLDIHKLRGLAHGYRAALEGVPGEH